MFKKVLIAEDHESSNLSIRRTLDELGIENKQYVFYCDDAYQRLNKALSDNSPYDLLVTDLNFEEDDRQQRIKDGRSLIQEARTIQPGIKVLVFSAESRPTVIENLFETLHIDAFVRKARRDVEELKTALSEISNNKKYITPRLLRSLREQNTYEFTEYDKILIKLLAEGLRQKDISSMLEIRGVKPSSLSSVEKRLGNMRELFGFTKNEQLVGFCKDLGVI